MTALYLPGAVWRPISYRAEAGKFTSPPLGYIPHVPVSNGSLFHYFNGLKSPNRKFSTGLIFKNGTSEQYTELTMKPWAQAAGNGQYHAFEVEGYPNEPYTAAQINTLAIWHNFLGTPDVLANAPGQRGIGVHYMGGGAWGGHTCPDPVAGAGPRSKQRGAIIARAQALRTPTPEVDMPLTAAEMDAIAIRAAEQVWNRFKVHAPDGDLTLQAALSRLLAVKPATVTSGAPVDVAALVKAINDDAARRMVT